MKFPHVDPRTLHAPGNCKACDQHPELQKLRETWGLTFTSQEALSMVSAMPHGVTPLKLPTTCNQTACVTELSCAVAGRCLMREPVTEEEAFNRGREVGASQQALNDLMDKNAEAAEKVRKASDPALLLGDLSTPPRTSTGGVTPGWENAGAAGPIGADGQHKSYWVLSEDERAEGFVRPVRSSYQHVGLPRPKHPMRPLSAEELERHKAYGYVMYESYPESELPLSGRFWTQTDLDKVNAGCGTITSMGNAIAETYARNPSYYGSTFCAGCRMHLPVGAGGEFVWVENGKATNERVGT